MELLAIPTIPDTYPSNPDIMKIAYFNIWIYFHGSELYVKNVTFATFRRIDDQEHVFSNEMAFVKTVCLIFASYCDTCEFWVLYYVSKSINISQYIDIYKSHIFYPHVLTYSCAAFGTIIRFFMHGCWPNRSENTVK